MEENRMEKRTFIGLFLLGLGVAFLLRNFNVLPSMLEDIIFSWQFLIVTIGVFSLISNRRKMSGWVILFVGLFFLIQKILPFEIRFWSLFWPAVFIVVGAVLLFRRSKDADIATPTDIDVLDEVAVFGGTKMNITSQEFKGGKITAIFGGADINLSQAQMSDSRNLLDVFTIFGGCTILVPHDWEVKSEVTSIMGGFSDRRRVQPTSANPDKLLVIKGITIFGGCDLKSV